MADPGKSRLFLGGALLAAALAAGGLAFVSGPRRTVAAQRPAAANPLADVERVSERVYRIGNVRVDREARTVTCPGRVNMVLGPIEYLAVAEGGKVHESALVLEVRPMHLQLGLILLGLEPKGGLTRQGDEAEPQGPPVRITVSWSANGKAISLPAEQLVWNRPKNRPMEPNAWVFSGSAVGEAGFLADVEKSLIATYRDPAAIINNRLPEGADDTVYDVNAKRVPPLNTRVTLTLHAPPVEKRE